MVKRALVVVDVQNDFITGSLATDAGEQTAKAIREHLDTKAHTYDYILSTQDWHYSPGSHWSDEPDYVNSWPKHCEANTWGAQLHSAIADFPFRESFYKGKFSAAYSGFEGVSTRRSNVTHKLERWLNQREVLALDVCGIATDYCVQATVLDAIELGYATTLLEHLCASVSEDTAERAISDMLRAGTIVLHQ